MAVFASWAMCTVTVSKGGPRMRGIKESTMRLIATIIKTRLETALVENSLN